MLPPAALLRPRRARSARRTRLLGLPQLVEHAAAAAAERAGRTGRGLRRRRPAIEDRVRLALPASQHGQDQTGGEEHRRQRGRGLGEHVRLAAAGEKAAATADAQAAAFRALQQHEADHGHDDHEVDDDDDGLHGTKSMGVRPARSTLARSYRNGRVSTRSPAAWPWGRDLVARISLRSVRATDCCVGHPQAAAMAKNSPDLRLAPPTSAPSTFSTFISSPALAGLTEPPYRIRMPSPALP